MSLHKIILTELGPQCVRDRVAIAIASLHDGDVQLALEQIDHLPLTLISQCASEQVQKVQEIFVGLDVTLEIVPPLPDPGQATPGSSVPPQHHGHVSRRLSIAVIVSIFAVAIVALHVGRQAISMWVKPDSSLSGSERMAKLLKATPNQIGKARQEIEQKLSQDPHNVDWLIQKGVLYLGIARKRMKDQGWTAYGQDSGGVPVEGADLMPIAEADSALATLFQALDLDSTNAETHRWLAETYLQKGLAPEAQQQAAAALALQDSNSVYRNLLGLAYLEDENAGRAEQIFRAAIQKSPDYLPSYRNLAELLLRYQGDSLQGMEWLYYYLVRDKEQDPDRYVLRQEMMATAFAQFNPPWDRLFPPHLPFAQYEVRRQAMVARMQSEKNSFAQEELALLFLSQGMFDAALPLLRELTQGGEASSVVWKMLVCVYARSQLWDAMYNALHQAQEQGVRDPFFSKNLGVVEKYWRMDRRAAAIAFGQYIEAGADVYRRLVDRELATLTGNQ